MNPSLDLNDIVLPDPIGWWPLAPGWWALILLALLLVVAAVVTIRVLLHRQRVRAPFHECRQRLSDLLSQQPRLSPWLCTRVNENLKILGKQRFPQCLALHGDAWAEFLTERAGVFTAAQLETLARGPYLSSVEGSPAELLQALELWLDAAEKRSLHES